MTKFRTQYDDPIEVGVDFDKEQKITKDSFKDECDINVIMKRAVANGQLPPATAAGQFGDFATLPEDYLHAHLLVEQAQQAFYALPPEVREAANNGPVTFLDKMQDPEWAKAQGLLQTPPDAAGSASGGSPSGQPAPAPSGAPLPEQGTSSA